MKFKAIPVEYKTEDTNNLQSAFVAGATFAYFSDNGSMSGVPETLKLYPRELAVINTEAAKRYPKGGCHE